MKATFKSFMLACMVMAAYSCSEKDLYNPEFNLEQKKAEYSQNFVNHFQGVNLNQSWDLTSSFNPYRELLSRADGGTLETVSGVQLPADAANSLLKSMPEGTDHSAMGSQFTIVSKGEFIVCPVWHGACKLYTLVIKAYDPMAAGDNTLTYVISADEVRTTMNYPKVTDPTQWIETNMTKNAPKGWILPFPKGTIVNFYLVDAGADTSSEAELAKSKAICMGHEQDAWSHRHEYSDFILLDDSKGDKDFNDLVLAVYTKEGTEGEAQQEAPEIVVDEKTIDIDEISAEKRYMIEDLGATDDFDFNDVVVDVRSYRRGTLTFENGVLVGNTVKEEQSAEVRALGGTLDFTLKVGETSWQKSSAYEVALMYNTEGTIDFNASLAKFDVTGWVPAENNIEVTVNGSNNEGVYTIKFPKAGEAPMIIAVDKAQNWMQERQSVPESWFTE